jgi:hypothetical protein
MTRGQQIILLALGLLLVGVIGALAFTLLNQPDSESPVPTRAVLVETHTQPPVAALAQSTAAATWTPAATRTPPPTSTPRGTSTATPLPTITRTFAPTFTPKPTEIVTETAVVTGTSDLINPGFEGVTSDNIPGWSWWAADNFTPGGDYNPDTSFDTPLFKLADDPIRRIKGSTLQIDATQHLKFKVYVYQTVPVSPTTQVRFEVQAGAYSDTGAVRLGAGILPNGGTDCEGARWSEILHLDQEGGVQRIVAPPVSAGNSGDVTVCLYAEPLYAAVSNAAFFDEAKLTLGSQE